jgi:hypothetical protein
VILDPFLHQNSRLSRPPGRSVGKVVIWQIKIAPMSGYKHAEIKGAEQRTKEQPFV